MDEVGVEMVEPVDGVEYYSKILAFGPEPGYAMVAVAAVDTFDPRLRGWAAYWGVVRSADAIDRAVHRPISGGQQRVVDRGQKLKRDEAAALFGFLDMAWWRP